MSTQSQKFVRSLHEGKECPECGGIHYGSRFCPYSEEGKKDSEEALARSKAAPAPAQQPEIARLEALLQEAVNAIGYESPIARKIRTELAHTSPEPPSAVRKQALEEAAQLVEQYRLIEIPHYIAAKIRCLADVAAPEPAEPSTPRALSAQDKWDINHSIEESHLDIEFMDAEQLRSEIRRLRTALAARSEAPAAPKEGK